MKNPYGEIVHCKIVEVEFVGAEDSLQGVPFVYITVEVLHGSMAGMQHTFVVEEEED